MFVLLAILFVVLPLGAQVVAPSTDWLWFHAMGVPGVFRAILSAT